jgi:hypothetical protein
MFQICKEIFTAIQMFIATRQILLTTATILWVLVSVVKER